jgi:hypothetical protein
VASGSAPLVITSATTRSPRLSRLRRRLQGRRDDMQNPGDTYASFGTSLPGSGESGDGERCESVLPPWLRGYVPGAHRRSLAWQCDHADHRRRTSARRRKRSSRGGGRNCPTVRLAAGQSMTLVACKVASSAILSKRSAALASVAKGKRGGIAAEHAKQKPGRPQQPCHGGPTTQNRRLPTPGSRSRFPRGAGRCGEPARCSRDR